MDGSEWERKGAGIQPRLNEVDEQWRQVRIDGDKKEAERLEVLWNELDEELRAHMKKQPSKRTFGAIMSALPRRADQFQGWR